MVEGMIPGSTIGSIKGDTRSLDNGSNEGSLTRSGFFG